jgi:hypothetical protein
METYETPNPSVMADKHRERHPDHGTVVGKCVGDSDPVFAYCKTCGIGWYNPAYAAINSIGKAENGEVVGWVTIRGYQK